jgi:NitT/TauT family transport system substrate-binding protein
MTSKLFDDPPYRPGSTGHRFSFLGCGQLNWSPARASWSIGFIQLLATLALEIGLSACAGAPPAPSADAVTVQLSWTHQAQFAGLYAADQNGDYAAEGLTVAFVEGGPNLRAITAVMDQSAQFGIAAADQVLLWRAEGQPVRAIATIYRHSPRVYIALAGSGITRPQDFVGKTIAVGRNGRPLLDVMMIGLGLGPDQYTVVESRPDLADFYDGRVQVAEAYTLQFLPEIDGP